MRRTRGPSPERPSRVDRGAHRLRRLVLLFGAWVRGGVARPVRETTAAAAEVAAGDFSIRLDENAAGEVGALVTAFNSMTRSLELGRREC